MRFAIIVSIVAATAASAFTPQPTQQVRVATVLRGMYKSIIRAGISNCCMVAFCRGVQSTVFTWSKDLSSASPSLMLPFYCFLAITEGYIPDGMTPEEWEKQKERDKHPNKLIIFSILNRGKFYPT